jgi:hypothetical protein
MMARIEPHDLPRREAALTAAVAGGCTVVVLAVYFMVPIAAHPHSPVWWRLLIGSVLFVVVLSHELTSILRHEQPMRRAIIALAVLIPLFIITFAWLYLTMSRSDPAHFGSELSRVEALYFTVTVLSTVGFGDIHPQTDPARLATSVQMVADLILLAVVVRLIIGVASRETERRTGVADEPSG